MLLLQLDFQLAAEEGDIASFIPNGEWALLGGPMLLKMSRTFRGNFYNLGEGRKGTSAFA